MTVKRGEIWLAALNPIRGSEQAGVRPILIFPNDTINAFTSTVITIPFTTNLRRAALPSCVRVSAGEGRQVRRLASRAGIRIGSSIIVANPWW